MILTLSFASALVLPHDATSTTAALRRGYRHVAPWHDAGMPRSIPLLSLLGAASACATAIATQAPAPPPTASPAPAAVAPPRPNPRAQPGPEEGFVPMFDGKTLDGWDGDPTYWRVEDGAIVGEVVPATVLKQNSFLIWRGGVTRDFELKVDYRVSAEGNSSLSYRNTEVEGERWVLRGYQADLDGEDRYTGQNYEERGRTFLALRGEAVNLRAGGRRDLVGSLGTEDELRAIIRTGDWNSYHLIVRGNVMIHILNGRVVNLVLDDDLAARRLDGLFGVQVHKGPPMKIEYKNMRLKRLAVYGGR